MDDFCDNEGLITKYLKEIDSEYSKDHMMAKNQTKSLARFPGTNTWYTDKIKYIHSTDRGSLWSFSKEDTKEEALALFDKGYNFFGWDLEWKMNFDLAEQAQDTVKEKTKTIDFSNDHEAHPDDVDLYSDKYILSDRLIMKADDLKEDIFDYIHHSSYQPFDDKSRTPNKLILLMHERAFRYVKEPVKNIKEIKGREEMDKLKKLIRDLKSKGIKFDGLSGY